MIWEPIILVFVALVKSIIGLLPKGEPPAWVSSGAGYLEQGLDKAAGLGAWFPFDVAGIVLASVLSCILVGFTIKIVRIVASFFTAGGGSAA